LYQKCVPDSFNSRSMAGFSNTTKKRSVNLYNPPAHHKNPRLSFVVNRLQGSPPPPQFPVSKTEILRTEDSNPQQSSRDAIPWGGKKRNRPHKQQQQQLYRRYGLLGTCMMHSSTLFPLCTKTTTPVQSTHHKIHDTHGAHLSHTLSSLKHKSSMNSTVQHSMRERERERKRERECGCLYVFSATYKFVNLCERKREIVCLSMCVFCYLLTNLQTFVSQEQNKNRETFRNFVRSSKLLVFQRKIICKLVR